MAAATWAPLGAGLDGLRVRYLHVWEGKLIVAGDFSVAGSIPANNVAMWDGVNWSPMGGGLVYPRGFVTHNGDLLAYAVRDSLGERKIFRWTGIGWAAEVPDDGWTDNDDSIVSYNGDLLLSGAWNNTYFDDMRCWVNR